MRLATVNVENLFRRPAVLDQPTWAEGREQLNEYTKFNGIIGDGRHAESRSGACRCQVCQTFHLDSSATRNPVIIEVNMSLVTLPFSSNRFSLYPFPLVRTPLAVYISAIFVVLTKSI